jgi:hypothetical protein
LEERPQSSPQVSDVSHGTGHAAFAGPDDAIGQPFQAIEPPLGLGEATVGQGKVGLKLCLLLDDKPHSVLNALPFPFGQASPHFSPED